MKPRDELSGRSAKAVAAILEGTPYRLIGFLGRGGMGEVWTCQHQFLRRGFALKILHSDQGQPDRMRMEAEVLGRINHPNVVGVVDFWTSSDGRPCIVMELLHGRSLWDELKDRVTLPVEEAVSIAVQALSALAAAHALGLVHRDVKPQNLFLHQPRDGERILKMLDFGLARVLPDAPEEAPSPPDARTTTGTLVGSPRYMSPEARRGEPVDQRGDLFSIGMVFYEMLTGMTPDNAHDANPEPPSRAGAEGVSAGLDAVLLRSIRARRLERFQTAEDYLNALRPFLPVPRRRRFH